MHLPFRSPLSPSLVAIAMSVVVAGCTDAPTTTAVDGIQMAQGGGKGPTVTKTDPPGAPQGTTLDVRVLGNGFEEGSNVELLLAGQATEKLKTNTVRFVSRRELVANITIDSDADIALYDVQVIGPGGKKGIGTELFAVQEKGNNESGKFEVTSFEVFRKMITDPVGLTGDPAIDAAVAEKEGVPSDYFGCPDPTRICNEIVMTFVGRRDSIGYKVSYNFKNLYHDETVGNHWYASAFSSRSIPKVPVVRSSGVVRVFWQGQRRTAIWDELTGQYHFEWDFQPDLDPLGSPSTFVFRPTYEGGTTGARMSGTAHADAFAEHQGESVAGRMFSVFDDFGLIVVVTRARGKKHPASMTIKMTFQVQAFTEPGRSGRNVKAHHAVIMVSPDGSKTLVWVRSVGINPDDPDEPDIYKTGFETTLTDSGCYQLELIGSYGVDNGQGYVGDKNIVWDPDLPGSGAGPIAVQVDVGAQTISWGLGSCL